MLEKSSDKNIKKASNIILLNANRLLRLINQLLDLSKLESGGMELKAALHPFNRFTSMVISSFSSLAKSRKIHLSFLKSDEDIEIYFDPEKLEKILCNLLSNAFKFTPAYGFIIVTINVLKSNPVKYPFGFVEISVQDSGNGIPQEELDTIFMRFSQGKNSKLRTFMGTGIGLALTKELVELHHGRIKVSSVVNEGTRFDVILPLGKDHFRTEEIVDDIPEEVNIESDSDIYLNDFVQENDGPSKIMETNSKTNKNLVLIIEDHPEVRQYIREHLMNEFQIIEAENGIQGLEIAQEYLPDLIISDVMMPEMDGYQLTDSIKKDILTSHIPIILLTAKASDDARIEGLETGADAYMAKPFNAKELEVRVKKLIESRIKLREKIRKEFFLEPTEVTSISTDDDFISRVHATIEEKMPDPDFNIEELLKDFALGQRQFTRKVQALTGQTPSQFIRIMRLKRAKQLISQKTGTISQIAFEVGFNNLSYFSKCFREYFGYLPSDI